MSKYTSYLTTIVVIFVVALCAVLIRSRSEDHLMARSLAGEPHTYRAYNNFPKPEIQDRDVYFHNIGSSVEEARKADIILLGHSVVLYGIDDPQMRAFNARYGVRIFNMAIAGIASGDFIRAVIRRWDIHPKLWIINADDEPVSFFNPGIDDAAATGAASAIEIVKTPRIVGFMHAYARDVRWWLGDEVLRLPEWMRQRYFQSFAGRFQVWRSTETGDWIFAHDGGGYDRAGNPKFSPPPKSCPVSAQEASDARNFLDDIGGEAIFTLIPYARWCPQHTTELAAALGVPSIIPPAADYTSPDGRHMDRQGREAFTTWFLDALADTREFKRIAVRQTPKAQEDYRD